MTETNSSELSRLVRTEELRHRNEIGAIASIVSKRAKDVRLVLIGGPSSAGKTTFAKRLTASLSGNGTGALAISTDDYFVGDAKNPRDENGKLDYEHIKAIDLDALNRDLASLIKGDEVLLPVFDFAARAPSKLKRKASLPGNSVLVIEGLHSLNPELTGAVPQSKKVMIMADTFASAFTILDGAEPGDGRLVRRIIRDSSYRGRRPDETLSVWPSVLEGEYRWIRPFERNAEFFFNTYLAFEPCVLKHYAARLLSSVPSSCGAFGKAQSLLSMISSFSDAGDEGIPGYSILREYIGGSSIEY